MKKMIICAVLLVSAIFADAKLRRPKIADHRAAYALGANTAMDITLEVLSEYRLKRRNISWLELQREVAARIQVKRDEWFMRRQ